MLALGALAAQTVAISPSPVHTAAAHAVPLAVHSGTGQPSLRYFSMWYVEKDRPASAASYANFLSTTASMAEIAAFRAAGGGRSLLKVEATFFCDVRRQRNATAGFVLCPGWRAAWAELLRTAVRPGLENGTLLGVFLGLPRRLGRSNEVHSRRKLVDRGNPRNW